jgi:CheY-like chemotaxis protein
MGTAFRERGIAMMRKGYGNKRQARILVADDELTIALTLVEILEEQGYEVAVAFSGEQAVAEAADLIPDLLITDVCMGEVNGVEAATAITAMLPDCRVLFLSGLASMSDVMSAAPERLVYSFMSKPMCSLDLLNVIAYMLPAVSTAHDPAAMTADRDALMRSAIGMRRAKTELTLSEVGA